MAGIEERGLSHNHPVRLGQEAMWYREEAAGLGLGTQILGPSPMH